MKVIPVTLKQANAIVAGWHRHNKPVVGCRYCLGAEVEGRIVGVVIVGRPVARNTDQQFVAEVNRLCVVDDAPKNTCSFLYGAARRVWFAMGGKKMITYTLQTESGSSLRGAGWEPQVLPTNRGKGWLSRERENQPVFAEPKIRWSTEAQSDSTIA